MTLRHYILLWLIVILMFCGIFIITYEVAHNAFDKSSAIMIGLLSMLIAMFIGFIIDRRP